MRRIHLVVVAPLLVLACQAPQQREDDRAPGSTSRSNALAEAAPEPDGEKRKRPEEPQDRKQQDGTHQDPANADGEVKYRKKTVVDFSDETIEGDLVKPEGSYVEARKKSNNKFDLKARSLVEAPTSEVDPTTVPEREKPAPEETAEPVARFQDYGVNPTVDTAEDTKSTFSVDVDTASYTLARSYLQGGRLPQPEAVRVEEFVNAFDYGYAPPATQDPFNVITEVYPSPNRRGYHLLQIGVKGREVTAAQRKPSNLVFVVDTSGSMEGENRLGLVKHALGRLVAQLSEGDTVAIVAYGDTAYVALPPTSAEHKKRILGALAALRTGGSTHAQAGILAGYQVARHRDHAGLNNRIILCSDGVANNGVTDADGIFATIAAEARSGIALTTVGFGMGHYNDVLMEKLADQGDGFYAYVDRPEEAERIFVRALTGTLQTIARDVKIQVDFNPAAVSRFRLLGYENRRLAHRDFANDKVDAGEIGAGHQVTALYEVKLREGAENLGQVHVRAKSPEGKVSSERTFNVARGAVKAYASDASSAGRLALVSAGFAEKLRQSYWARTLSYDDLLALHAQLPPELRRRPEVAELGELIATAKRLDARKDRWESVQPVARMDFDRLPGMER